MDFLCLMGKGGPWGEWILQKIFKKRSGSGAHHFHSSFLYGFLLLVILCSDLLFLVTKFSRFSLLALLRLRCHW